MSKMKTPEWRGDQYLRTPTAGTVNMFRKGAREDALLPPNMRRKPDLIQKMWQATPGNEVYEVNGDRVQDNDGNILPLDRTAQKELEGQDSEDEDENEDEDEGEGDYEEDQSEDEHAAKGLLEAAEVSEEVRNLIESDERSGNQEYEYKDDDGESFVQEEEERGGDEWEPDQISEEKSEWGEEELYENGEMEEEEGVVPIQENVLNTYHQGQETQFPPSIPNVMENLPPSPKHQDYYHQQQPPSSMYHHQQQPPQSMYYQPQQQQYYPPSSFQYKQNPTPRKSNRNSRLYQPHQRKYARPGTALHSSVKGMGMGMGMNMTSTPSFPSSNAQKSVMERISQIAKQYNGESDNDKKKVRRPSSIRSKHSENSLDSVMSGGSSLSNQAKQYERKLRKIDRRERKKERRARQEKELYEMVQAGVVSHEHMFDDRAAELFDFQGSERSYNENDDDDRESIDTQDYNSDDLWEDPPERVPPPHRLNNEEEKRNIILKRYERHHKKLEQIKRTSRSNRKRERERRLNAKKQMYLRIMRDLREEDSNVPEMTLEDDTEEMKMYIQEAKKSRRIAIETNNLKRWILLGAAIIEGLSGFTNGLIQLQSSDSKNTFTSNVKYVLNQKENQAPLTQIARKRMGFGTLSPEMLLGFGIFTAMITTHRNNVMSNGKGKKKKKGANMDSLGKIMAVGADVITQGEGGIMGIGKNLMGSMGIGGGGEREGDGGQEGSEENNPISGAMKMAQNMFQNQSGKSHSKKPDYEIMEEHIGPSKKEYSKVSNTQSQQHEEGEEEEELGLLSSLG